MDGETMDNELKKGAQLGDDQPNTGNPSRPSAQESAWAWDDTTTTSSTTDGSNASSADPTERAALPPGSQTPVPDAEVVSILNDLLQLDHDALSAYSVAIATLKNQ